MADVTIQVVQGLEAGSILRSLPTPITIGREDENLVQLNDERISRFHAKIQSHEDQLIFTDLQSTNGSRVNGHFTRMRTIQIGDQIALGRCLLVVGSPEELAALDVDIQLPTANDGMGDDAGDPVHAFPLGPHKTPTGLSPQQMVDIATLLEFTRTELLSVLHEVSVGVEDDDVQLSRTGWHKLQSLPVQLSQYLSELVDPSED